MKAAYTGSLLLACALSLNAQITAVLKRPLGRSPEIEIRNTATVDLTAFAITMAPVAQSDTDGSAFLIYIDTAIEADRKGPYQLSTSMPLPPNQTYEVAVPAQLRDGQRQDLFSRRLSRLPCSPTEPLPVTQRCCRA